jgi:hypothetical protein
MDFRAKLMPKPGGANLVLGPRDDTTSVLYPLWQYGGLVFPYTPNISYGVTSEYKELDLTHTNYKLNTFVKSYPQVINLEADFTAQTNSEAEYMLAAIHYLRTASRMYFGAQNSNNAETRKLSGTPPPVLNFSYMGKMMFDNVPVVIESFNMTFDKSFKLVEVAKYQTYVPVKATISIALDTNYNTNQLKNNFDLDQFRKGKYLNGTGTGGFI